MNGLFVFNKHVKDNSNTLNPKQFNRFLNNQLNFFMTCKTLSNSRNLVFLNTRCTLNMALFVAAIRFIKTKERNLILTFIFTNRICNNTSTNEIQNENNAVERTN